MNGMIFNIQRFCVNDGPGIRTTVFLKGCPLRCAWCHNPESHRIESQLMYDVEKCLGCGKCAPVCETGAHCFEDGRQLFRPERCNGCGKCTAGCPGNALEMVGRRVLVDECLEEVLKDRIFYENSGGGMTVSGGEPLTQPEFTCALLQAARDAGLHCCVETCGYAPKEVIRQVARLTDLFLYDWKLTDPGLHRQYTGVSNKRIAENLRMIDALGARIILRCPIIPGVNDTPEHFAGIAGIAETLRNVLKIEVEPYHSLGIGKYHRLGKESLSSSFEMPGTKTVAGWIEDIRSRTEIPVSRA